MVVGLLGFHHQANWAGSVVNLAEAQEKFIDGAVAIYQHLEAVGYPIRFHEYYRDREAQNRYYASGASKAKFGESPHNYGLAADYHWKDYGWDVPDSWWRLTGMMEITYS